MKKTVALIIMIAVIISCFTGCENKTVAFDDFENLAISAALSYRTLVWNGSMDTDTPEFAWNTAGWYAAYKANLEFADEVVLSEDQLKEIQNVILTGEAVMTPPDDIDAEAETRDGKTYWKFPEINDDFNSYLGVISEVNCEKAQNNSYVVTIRDHLRFNVVEETVFNIGFKEENDGYILSEFSRNEFIDLDFTTDLLYDANHLSNLFSIYDNLTITEDYSSGYGSLVYSRKTDNGYTLWMDDGSSGFYDEFRFYTSDNATGKVSVMPADTSSDWLDDYIATMRLPDEGADLIRLTSQYAITVLRVADSARRGRGNGIQHRLQRGKRLHPLEFLNSSTWISRRICCMMQTISRTCSRYMTISQLQRIARADTDHFYSSPTTDTRTDDGHREMSSVLYCAITRPAKSALTAPRPTE